MPRPVRPTDPTQAAIYRTLTALERTSGGRLSTIFADWIALAGATLAGLPYHARALQTTGALISPDPPPIAALWDRLRGTYGPAALRGPFAAAWYSLLGAPDPFVDHLGPLYMALGQPNTHAGQFFTPPAVCQLMARMTVDPAEPDRRFQAAIAASPAATAALLAGSTLSGPDAQKWLTRRVLPLARPWLDPVGISEPACGSGGMLLAVAACYPRRALAWGLVEVEGMDLDPLCVAMCRLNLGLAGIPGQVRCANTLSDPLGTDRAPDPWGPAWAAWPPRAIPTLIPNSPTEAAAHAA